MVRDLDRAPRPQRTGARLYPLLTCRISSRDTPDTHIEPVIRARMLDEPVIALQDTRAVGKTTLLRALAAASGASILDLDDPATRAAVEADPITFVSGPGPALIDE